MGHVIIGMDPHKRSATIEVIDSREGILAQGRFGTDRDGYKAMLAVGRGFADRVRAVGGCGGIGRHIAQRLVADGESVLDVPAKLSARARVFATGQGRKTDATDAHSVAVVALRTDGLQVVAADGATVALRLTCIGWAPQVVPAERLRCLGEGCGHAPVCSLPPIAAWVVRAVGRVKGRVAPAQRRRRRP